MRKKMDLKLFNVYQYLKEQYAIPPNVPFFLATQDTYGDANIRFPIRTFSYGIGITCSGGGAQFKAGTASYCTQRGSLVTIGPGVITQWTEDGEQQHETIYFTEALLKHTIKPSLLSSLPFFLPGGNHVITLAEPELAKITSLFRSLREFREAPDVITGIVYALLMLVIQYHRAQSGHRPISAREKLVSDFKSLNVQEICHWLGYADASYFSKVFRNQTGMTPLAYRKK
jgi:AraC family transcriptional activator of pobA